MIAITDNTTVGEVAGSVPASVRVFQQFGIDFCCGGGKTLAEACSDKGVPLDQLLAGVTSAQQSPATSATKDWSSAKLENLIDHILAKHHAFLRAEFPRLGAMLAKVIEVHGQKHPESLLPLGRLYSGLRKELEEHMWKEENILFPLIRQLEQAEKTPGAMRPGMPVGGPIDVMQMEHESAGEALRKMREVSSGFQAPADGCATYRALFDGFREFEADLHEHIHLENNILFPRALELGG